MKKVLVLEDESSIRGFVVINLRRAGFEPVEAACGQEALDALLKYSVTAEGLVGERIHNENKWFWPWSPNASGAARIVLMMLAQEESGE